MIWRRIAEFVQRTLRVRTLGPEADAHALFAQANAEARSGAYHLSVKTLSLCLNAAQRSGLVVHFSIYGLRGIANYKIGEFSAALEDTNTAIGRIDANLEPDDVYARLYYQRAMFYTQLHNKQAADSDFAMAQKFDPEGLCVP